MFKQGATGGLSSAEKRVVKRLLQDGWKNQDIQAEINSGRSATINFSRIATVKTDQKQLAADNHELSNFFIFKRAYDPKTGLNPYIDERLVKSREAMKLAVGVFNNPTLTFRAETFSMLANVAWTYLSLEYASRNGLATERTNGNAISLSDFLKFPECPYSEGVKNNLKAIVAIRDAAEHRLLGNGDDSWLGIFQACCVNYEKEICKHFSERVSLAGEISFSLQLSGLTVGQAQSMAKADMSSAIVALNAEMHDGLTPEQRNDKEFQFSVVYTTVESSKAKAAFQFVSPKSAEGIEIANVLVKHKPSAITHPYKPTDVAKLVRKKTGRQFSVSDHTTFWKEYQVRPDGADSNPAKTNLDYCYYDPTYKGYTYNEAWIEVLVNSWGGAFRD